MQTTKLILLVFPLLLSGCAAVPLILSGVGLGGVAVNETTGKTITDHTVSVVNSKDCRVSRAFRDQEVCQDEIPQFQFQVTTTGVTPSTIEEIESKYR